MEEHNRCAPLLGEKPVSASEARHVDKRYASVLNRYGSEMKESYGWAAGQLGLPLKPKFNHLQELAGSTPMRLHYKLASFGVHVTPQANTVLSLIDSEVRLAGATNGGLEYPGANTAATLCRMTSLLFEEPWDLDKISLGQALLQLRDETEAPFHTAARRLERDEQRRRDHLEREATRRGKGPGKRIALRHVR